MTHRDYIRDCAGRLVTTNGGWGVSDDDTVPGDTYQLWDGPETLVTELPTGPVESRDAGIIPACAFCNHENNLSERRWEAIRYTIKNHEWDEEALEYDGIIRADYALVNTETATVEAFTCHACIQG